MYSGKGFSLVVDGTVAQPAREPSYELSQLQSLPDGTAGDPVAVATAFLAAHGLTPTWAYRPDVQAASTIIRVRFLRSSISTARARRRSSTALGTNTESRCVLPMSSPGAFASGPLPLTLDSISYPIISADQAVRSALASSAPSSAGASYPTVKLTSAELVYTLVWAGDHSFYEPAFLFSGTFTYQGDDLCEARAGARCRTALLSP